jgi:hypothetical protein
MENLRTLKVAGSLLSIILILLLIVISQRTIEPMPTAERDVDCSKILSAMESSMEINSTQRIPETCFQRGEPMSDMISGAESGDSFRKTPNGIKLVQ